MDAIRKSGSLGHHRSLEEYPPVLTIAQAAALLQIPIGTLRNWRADGRVRICSARQGRHVRFLRDRLLQWFFGSMAAPKPAKHGQSGRLRLRKPVTIYQRGAIWHARIVVKGRSTRQTLKTKDRAKAERRAMRLWKRHSGRKPAGEEKTTLHSAIKAYLAYLRSEQRAAKTLSKYQCALKKFGSLARREGVRRLSQVTVGILDKYRSQRTSAGAAPKSLFSETVTIKQLLNFAVSRGLLSTHPLRALKLKKPKSRPQPFWTIDQVQQILTATKGSVYHNVYVVLAETGMRIGEVVFLTWEDLDLERKVLYVREKQLDSKRKRGDTWKPKTGEHRVVPLTQNLIQLFRQLPTKKCPWVFSRPSRNSAKPGSTRINDRNVLSHLKCALKELGLAGHVHTFRHSFISHALMRGVPEAVVREWVGHVDSQTIRWYTHIADKESHAQMERLFEAEACRTDADEPKSEPVPEFCI